MDRKASIGVLLSLFLIARIALAQSDPSADPRGSNDSQSAADFPPKSGVPVITGDSGFITNFTPGNQDLGPVIAPIILVPLGSKFLIEAEAEFDGDYSHSTNQPWTHRWNKGLEYGQIDYLATKDLTLVAGRFLTPFGIYNEGLHPTWIRDMLNAPFIANFEMTDSNGAMVRGAIPLTPGVDLDYAGFFSASSTVTGFDATRAGGGRLSLFFPGKRLGIGVSFQRTLQNQRFNTAGVDLTYQFPNIPLNIRGEYANGRLLGSGYWVEGAYRMIHVPLAHRFMRKSQVVARWQQFVAPGGVSVGVLDDLGLPEANARQCDFGWNYYLSDALKVGAAYGRRFSPIGDMNVVTVGLAYRFTFPLGGGK